MFITKKGSPSVMHGTPRNGRKNPRFTIQETPYLNNFVDNICRLRLSLRVLLGYLFAFFCHIGEGGGKNGVYEEADMLCEVKEAIDDASSQCQKCFGEVPKVVIHDRRKCKRFVYIPEHLHHIFFELLKNAMRAVCETHSNKLKPIDINSTDTITIKIEDKGGGIPRTDIDNIWLYSYTTAVDPYGRTRKELFELLQKEAQIASQQSMLVALKNIPMFGLGYGLSIAKLYARYYGGDCKIFSIHGHGTDAYVYLNDLFKSNSTTVG
ncbi:pyruvate dehydrogenase kinase [Reticulomyxa filosa]|uniref:Protein-serine/threonine kinase n=1 Tax=Reticulomyxa filosa TaxID=46433 RepID=X6M898_RETFI|nr:pyruvate dehydrogenase kinase [Reticulomyxa filosa]|eukprot:ETO10139.1 pyruvate dehydrogenase kinase [Reticulomyxa filosa]